MTDKLLKPKQTKELIWPNEFDSFSLNKILFRNYKAILACVNNTLIYRHVTGSDNKHHCLRQSSPDSFECPATGIRFLFSSFECKVRGEFDML